MTESINIIKDIESRNPVLIHKIFLKIGFNKFFTIKKNLLTLFQIELVWRINMKTVILSYYIDNNSAYYVGTTKPVIKPINQIVWGEDYNTYIIQVGNHCGTHVDAPRHFISSGKSIYDYDIMELIYSKIHVC